MIEESLEEIGFSPSEIKVYLYLLRKGSGYANRISSETGINRTNVYEALDRLALKGAVYQITKNRLKWFAAKPPEGLIAIFDNKEEQLLKSRKAFLDGIKQLKKTLNPNKESLKAGIFTGKKGLRIIFDELLEEGKPICFFASKLQFKQYFDVYFEKWHRQRADKGIRQRSIIANKFRQLVTKRKLLEYRFIDDLLASPTTTIISGDACIFIEWSQELFAVRIRNHDIAKSHANYFEMLWKSVAKK